MNETALSNEQMIAQLKQKIQSRTYREKKQQLRLSNKMVLFTQMLSELCLLVNLVFLLVNRGVSVAIIFTLAWIVIGQTLCAICYFRDTANTRFSHMCILQFGVAYSFDIFINHNSCMVFLVFPLFVATIAYNNRKQMNLTILACGLVNTVRLLCLFANVYQSTNGINEEMLVYAILIFLLFIIIQATAISWKFNHDAMYSMRDEQKIQELIMENVLEIVKGVQNQTSDATVKIEHLYDSAQNINSLVNDISAGTQDTAQTIQKQTVMTQSIQNAIQETAGRTTNAVEKATASINTIHESLHTMDELRKHSDTIADANEKVVTSMEKLQAKTRDVKDITNMILDISSQTNLLSLNATIEAARAGEAGRGFAVVAEQISQLAEQTKNSTESITEIVEELGIYSTEAANSIQESLQVASTQTELIENASHDFDCINGNMQELTSEMHKIDNMIDELKDSNNVIVDSINQLSSSSQEITDNSKEAADITENNKENSKQIKEMLDKILHYSHQLDQYMHIE